MFPDFCRGFRGYGTPMKISIDQAVCVFGAVRALDGVSLEIADGELFFLLGASGCGKTTLLRALAGFQELASGAIRFDGKDIAAVPAHQRNAGMMFQGYALWPHMTVAENVAFGLEQRGVNRADREARVRRVLEQVRIADLAGRKPNQLSGGQQQRVALARTLVVEPGVLLLDEPLANLDAKLRLEMRNEIRRLCKESGLTAVYVTHDQKEALSVSDRLAVMDRGRLAQVGTPRGVYTRPATAFVAEFIGETHFLPARVTAVEAGAVRLETPLGVFRSTAFPDGLAVGSEVVMSLRPEALRPAPASSASLPVNRFAATVRDTVYLGAQAQYAVAAAADGARTFQVLEQNPRTPLAPGTAVSLEFDPADTVVLPR